MPELPEVEAVRLGLDQTIVNKKVTNIEIYWDNIIKHNDLEQFKDILIGQTCQSIKRRGKFLLFYFDTHVMLSHLRMEGKYFFSNKQTPLDKHTHVVIELDHTDELRYHDVRKFGRMELVRIGEEWKTDSLSKLGPEPTIETFSEEDINSYLTNKTTAIKNILLDQKMVAGLGNIYVDEVLFRSNIHPGTSATNIDKSDVKRLYNSIIHIMDEAIKAGGSTIRTYTNMFGEAGDYQNQHQVYAKDGQPCRQCQSLIKKIKIGGRGTHYCPSCQKKAGK